MNDELLNKIAIVTGGAQGIGAAVARVMRREGATIVIADLNEEKAAGMANELGGDCSWKKVDISDDTSRKELVSYVIEKYGRIDILVNNAGISAQVDFMEITEVQFNKFININLNGMVFLTQLVMKHMIRNEYGRIVNLASLAGERGGLFAGIHYSTSKAGVINATKCMALRGGPHNITVNAVAPGLINTPMGQGLSFSTAEIPMKRLGTAEEVAEVVSFLASDRARYITGSTTDVNGGIFMR